MKKFLLEFVVFVCGVVVMIFEIVGSRILGPYLGTSIFVWTSLIGIILGSLSLGYWLGGIIADKKPSYVLLSWIILLAALFIGLTITGKDIILRNLPGLFGGIRTQSIIASFCLFAPTSILLGMVAPYAVKLKIRDIKTSGKTVGNLYAISTIGSIIGTFLAGFFLIPSFGSTNILYFNAFLLIIVALTIFIMSKYFTSVVFGLVLLGILLFYNIRFNSSELSYIDIDTRYNRVLIYESVDWYSGKPVRVMRINNEYSSSMFLDNDSLVYPYLKYYQLAEHFKPNFRKTLMIGGAGYSYPTYYLKKYPKSYIDVVEIDKKLTELARTHFRLKDSPRLNIHHEDGRIFLNRTKNKYDVILGDAFKSIYTIPWQLTTLEAIKKEYDILTKDGIVIINIISTLEGPKSLFLQAEYNTYKAVFPQVYLFDLDNFNDPAIMHSIILLALKSDKKPIFNSPDPELNGYLQHVLRKKFHFQMPVLTDEHAPVEYYANKAI
jgi:spermidine synthase